ncbi:MAG TPA: dienelactone hydrolase family protein [Solirubrobacteraceae bacterium]|jgi:carboxymethylenebutenolidase|nr:dienelactone hydrolase family protein [Solirubrobacteraceae bacterium]
MASVEVRPSPEGVPGAVVDSTRIAAEELTFASADGVQVNGYLARPADTGSYPAVIVIHEASGLIDYIRDVSNRLANIGYVALAVDLYTREGGPPPMGDPAALMERLFSIPDARVLDDLEGAADYLRARDDATGRVGCIGFCMGGRYTLLFACSSDRLNAAVDCWGGFIDGATPDQQATPERPVPPLELADRLRCPLLAAIGAEDLNPSPDVGMQLLERARTSGQEVKVDVYEGAGHAFFADYRPTYRPAPAAKLWEEALPFLARHLQAG